MNRIVSYLLSSIKNVHAMAHVADESKLRSVVRSGPLSIKLYVVLAMCVWFESPLFSFCIPNHKHLASTT